MVSLEEIIELALVSFLNIKEVVNKSADIEKSVEQFKLNKEGEANDLLESINECFDRIFSCSERVKKTFKEKLNEYKSIKSKKNVESNDSEGSIDENVSNVDGEAVSKSLNNKSAELKISQSKAGKNNKKVSKKNRSDLSTNKGDEGEKINEIDPLEAGDKDDAIESSVTEENSSESVQDYVKIKIEDKPEVPKIRLVDLNKLIDPSTKKSVTFDNSVIILTSSDEENHTPKKTTKGHNGGLKSALKKTPPITESVKRLRKSNSSDESSANDEYTSKKKKTKLRASEINDIDSEYYRKKSQDSSKKKKAKLQTSDVEEDSEEHNDRKKSSRIKKKELEKEKKKRSLKLVLSRGKHDKEYTAKSRCDFEKKSTGTVASDASLSSSDDDLELVKNKSKSESRKETKKVRLKDVENDDKFDREVYVPLPLIKCEKLKETYLTNKEILEIKRLTNLKTLFKLKSSSSSSAKSKKGTSKKSVCKSKKSDSENDQSSSEKEADSDNKDSSFDTPLATVMLTSNETKEKRQENDKEAIAEIELEMIQDTDQSLKNTSESDEEVKKSKSESECKESDNESETDNNCKNTKNSERNEGSDKESDVEPAAKESSEETENNKSDNEESDTEKNKNEKSDWKKNKLLNEKLDSSDSDDFIKPSKKKDKVKSTAIKKKKIVISDSDESDREKNCKDSDEDSEKDKTDSSQNEDSNSEPEEVVKKKSTLKRIKRTRNSSSSSEDNKSTRKHIRKLINKDSLSESTKKAEAEEKERKARIAEKQKKYNSTFEEKMDTKIEKIVLEYSENKQKELLTIDPKLVKNLKPHQANGIQFMWDACFESLERARKSEGSGCILAHCMGLGKTLQVIALADTLLKNKDKTNVEKILVVCPVNTVLNWKAEFKKWLPKSNCFDVYELVSCKQNFERQFRVTEWFQDGGVLIIGYSMFRNLSNPDNKRLSKKFRTAFTRGLVDPGPDLVICDEGHLLKNEKTHLSIAMNRIKTARRIVLTGTPLQNNLKEYWCMVQFIKPNLLGTYKEYLNRFVNPIINGQYTDSTQHDIMVMRKRSHVLHKLLDGVVQRRDYSVLEPYLPPKLEYVVFVRLSEVQIKIYKHYMDHYAKQSGGSNKTSFLFTDFQQLQRICTHPRVLADKSKEKNDKFDDDDDDSEGSLKDFIDDGSASNASDSKESASSSDSEDEDAGDKSPKKVQQRVRVTRAQAAQRRENNEDSDPELVEIRREWWQDFCDGDELDNIENSGKMFLLFQILKECEEIGDKVLIFSQSLYTLNCIEYFLEKIDTATNNGTNASGFTGNWSLGLDYFRLDGSSSCDDRAYWCDSFNNPDNIRARLFLISTKAGGLGINLVAANRVIIFDVSWNPSHDIQSIYRVYRFGQKKPCYIYRFVTYGAMEMKIYERQVTKQAISKRVIDEQQIDRHYNQNDLQELYKCDLEPDDRPIPLVPKDVLLGELLQNHDKIIYKYHIHQSLLENKENEVLNEEERKAAWEEFENEKVLRKTSTNYDVGQLSQITTNPRLIHAALRNIVQRDNPTWSLVQINGIVPALIQQLQVQMRENNMSMYARVQQEIYRMQVEQAQQNYIQQQLMRQQVQQRQHDILGNMFVDPNQLRSLLLANAANATSKTGNRAGPSVAPSSALPSGEVIELPD